MHRALFLDNATKPSTQETASTRQAPNPGSLSEGPKAGDTGEQEWRERNALVSHTPGIQ